MWTNNASSSFESIMMQNFSVMYFILMIFMIEFLLYYKSLMYGMLHFWCDFIVPTFVLILNGLFESCMFDTYIVLQNTVSVKSLSNMMSYFILTACANEQCNPDHPITGYSFLINKLLILVISSPSLFDCTCCWAFFIAHSYFVILSLVLKYGYLCPDFTQQ